MTDFVSRVGVRRFTYFWGALPFVDRRDYFRPYREGFNAS